MIKFKITIFLLTIISVRLIFKYIIDIGDKKIIKMKEFIDFTEYLRIYSCDMKMSLEQILLKYNYKSQSFKNICYKFSEEIRNDNILKINKNDLLNFIEITALTPNDFNLNFIDIIDYYGSTYSDVLNKKLIFTTQEMTKKLIEYEDTYKERKEFFNKASVLFGCLTAIILI